MDDSWSDETHLTPLEVARYLDAKSSAAERERVEAHLADCADCRGDVASAKAILAPRRWPRRVTGAVATLAAAGIILIVGTHVRSDRDGSSRSLMRAAPHDASQLLVYAPNRSSPPRGMRFVWAAAPGALSYQFTFSSADGTPLFARSGADTALTLPDSVVLQPGASYLWTTDALLPDGSTRSTGVREVDVTP